MMSQEARVADCEREVEVAEALVQSTKMSYDTIVSRMTEELNRYQKVSPHLSFHVPPLCPPVMSILITSL